MARYGPIPVFRGLWGRAVDRRVTGRLLAIRQKILRRRKQERVFSLPAGSSAVTGTIRADGCHRLRPSPVQGGSRANSGRGLFETVRQRLYGTDCSHLPLGSKRGHGPGLCAAGSWHGGWASAGKDGSAGDSPDFIDRRFGGRCNVSRA